MRLGVPFGRRLSSFTACVPTGRYALLLLLVMAGCAAPHIKPPISHSITTTSQCLNQLAMVVRQEAQEDKANRIKVSTYYGHHGLKVGQVVEQRKAHRVTLWLNGPSSRPTHIYTDLSSFVDAWPMPWSEIICYANVREA